ncbi:MAG: hypothetical protein J6U71_07580 [Bacteroidales bacterium]|nr:hypothetical protein [Bacteroidales bacterium]
MLDFHTWAVFPAPTGMAEPQSCLAMVKEDLIEYQYSDRNDGYYAK